MYTAEISIKKKWKIIGIAIVLSLGFVQIIGTQNSSAMFARGAYQGYFTGSYATSGEQLRDGGFAPGEAQDINSFISTYRAWLYSGDRKKETAAAFTILTMLEGYGPGTSKNEAKTQFSRWERLMTDYDRAGRINYNKSYTFNKNTFYQTNGDVAWYYDGGTLPSIVITAPGGKTYAIKRNCANPVGELNALPDLRWELDAPLTRIQTNSGSWTSKDIKRPAGATIKTQYRVSNNSKGDTTNFQRWREVNYRENRTLLPSGTWRDGTKNTSRLDSNHSTQWDELTFVIPGSASAGSRYCWKATVQPRSSDDNSSRTGNDVCVQVTPPPGDCPPSHPNYPCLPPDEEDDPVPSWALSLNTTLNAPYVEQGGSVTWTHTVTNTDPNNRGGKIADGFTRCAVFNYQPYNPNAGAGGSGFCGANFPASIPPGTHVYQDDSPTLTTNSGTPLGTTFCQRYSVGRQAESNYTPADSANVCAVVVGGKSYHSVNATKPYIEPTETVTFSSALNTSVFQGGNGYPGYGITCEAVTTVNGGNPVSQNCNQTVDENNYRNPISLISRDVTGGNIGDRICMTVTIRATNGNINLLRDAPNAEGKIVRQQCVDVIARPYMTALGGDVSAGSSFGGGGCTVSGARIMGWNLLNDGPGTKPGNSNLGAGTKYAAFAQGVITGFASGQNVRNDQANGFAFAPANLSFANTTTNTGASNFGGNFGGATCMIDYAATQPKDETKFTAWPGSLAQAVATKGARVYKYDGDLVLNAATVTDSTNVRLYVTGDVTIAGNIVGDNSKVEDISQVANFGLYVDGNISIKSNVSELYGIYVAQPKSNSSKGEILTCEQYRAPVTAAYAGCGATKLTFTGSVIAKKIYLQRTFGSLYRGGTPTTAAEVFKYNPLTWLFATAGTSVEGNDKLDAITTLPPVL